MTRTFLTSLACAGLGLWGVALFGFYILTPGFAYEIQWLDRPNVLIVLCMMLAGFAYLVFIFALLKGFHFRLIVILVLGFVVRIAFVFSVPVYEDDFYRYFWDAELTSQGLNPYAYAPIDVQPLPFPAIAFPGSEAAGLASVETKRISQLNELASLSYLDRIAYPTIRTIYPPITQAFFALSHWMSPANLVVWRLILLFTDCVSVLLLMCLLAYLKLDLKLVAIYWLNPLVIVETINAAHMDVLLVPFLLLAVLLSLQKRYAVSGLVISVAVGIKLWPVILVPILFKPLFSNPRALVIAAMPFLGVTCLLLAPQLLTRLDSQAGLLAYAGTWHVNAFLYTYWEQLFIFLLGEETTGFWDPHTQARFGVALAVLFVLLQLLREPQWNREHLVRALLWVSAALFLFSPSTYPWYFLWVLPWLAIQPNFALLLLTALLPLYYLRYALTASDLQHVFEHLVLGIEFVPSLLLIGYSLIRKRMQQTIK